MSTELYPTASRASPGRLERRRAVALPRGASQQCGACLLTECPVLGLPSLGVTADLVRTWVMDGTYYLCGALCGALCVAHCAMHCAMHYGCTPIVQLMVDEIARTPGTVRACLQSWYL